MQIKKNAYLFAILPIALLAYLMDWQYDEAWTYFAVEKTNVQEMATYSSFKYANNHVINSLYFKIGQFLDIKTPLFYRLLSILGLGLFLFANNKLFKLFNLNTWYLLPLCIAPYFVFFAMGRGYALSLGTLALALYLVLKAIKLKNTKHLLFATILLIIAAVSNFSFVYIANALFAVIGILSYRNNEYKQLTISILLYGIGLTYIFFAGRIVSNFDPYIIGSDSFFANGTIQSLLGEFSYSKLFLTFGIRKTPMILVAFAFSALTVITCIYAFKTKDDLVIRLILIVSLLAIIQIVLSHLFLGVPFPIKRATIFLHYFVILSAIWVTKTSYPKFISYLPLFILFTLSLINVFWTFLDLKNPSLSEVIQTTEETNLYHLGYNPAIDLQNQVHGKKSTVYHHYEKDDIIDAISQQEDANCFLLTPRNNYKSAPFKAQLVLKTRGQYELYRISK